jgi:hypothetical protein
MKKTISAVVKTVIVWKQFDHVVWSDFFFYIFLIYVMTIVTWFLLFLILHLGFSYYWLEFWPKFPTLRWFFTALVNDFYRFKIWVYSVFVKPYLRYWTFFTPLESYFISTYVLILLYFVYL